MTNADTQSTRPTWWEWLFLGVVLATFLGMMLAASPRKSASFDEQFHLGAGYSYLKTGDYRMASTHPPLGGMIAALTILGDDAIVLPQDNWQWETGNRWDWSDLWLWFVNDNGPEIIQRARLGIMALGLLLVTAIWFWSRSLFGRWGALIATLLVAFDPNIVANSRQITTDIPLTCFLFLTMWQLWRWLMMPRWYGVLVVGILTGLTLAAKYNGVLLAPLIFFTLIIHPLPVGRARARAWLDRLGALLAIGVTALAVLWALYKFDFGSATLFGVTLPMPAPWYWNQLGLTVGNLVAQGEIKPDFLMGMVGTEGWWYYFPVAIMVKTPLPLLVMMLAGVIAMFRYRTVREQAAIWLPPLAFLLVALSGVLTIGYRHVLAALPFAALLAGNNVRWAQGRSINVQRVLQGVGAALLLWLVVSTVRFWPNHDSYFNELAGRWQNWSNLLVDSNLDWGQDLPALAQLQQQMGIAQLNLAYFGRSVPEKYGVVYSPLPGFQRFLGADNETNAYNPVAPEPGWYAVSATALRLGTITQEGVDLYAYFRDLAPVARAGYSIYLYEVPDSEPGARTLFTRGPVYGQAAERLTTPAGRVQAKWRGERSVDVQWGDTVAIVPGAQRIDAAFAAGSAPVFTLTDAMLGAEPARGKPLAFRLYFQRGSGLMPMPAPTKGEPVNAFVHLVEGAIENDDATTFDAGKTVQQWDGWGVALRGLEEGDYVVISGALPISRELAPGAYTVLAGLYSPQDGARLGISQQGVNAASQIGAAVVGTIVVE